LHVAWNCIQSSLFFKLFPKVKGTEKNQKNFREKYVPKQLIFTIPMVKPSFKRKEQPKENYQLIIPCPNQAILRVKVYISVDFLLISDIIKVLTKDVITIWRI
jgi:hypothetical protein